MKTSKGLCGTIEFAVCITGNMGNISNFFKELGIAEILLSSWKAALHLLFRDHSKHTFANKGGLETIQRKMERRPPQRLRGS